jgi:hypothetical protein
MKSGTEKTQKTAGAEYLTRTLNTLFNPFEFEDILSPPQATPFSRALHHAGGLALGYGGLAVVMRKMMQYKTDLARGKDEEKLKSYAAARYPTMSPDPNVDPEAERELVAPGVEGTQDLPELDKGAALGFESGAWAPAKPLASLAKRTVWGAQDPAHLALATAAAVIGGTAGWKLADYIEDKRRGRQLGTRVESAADEIDQLLYDELEKKNQKVASGGRLTTSNIQGNPYRGVQGASGEEGGNEPGMAGSLLSPSRFMKGAETMWWLWAVASFALTYKAAKAYGDSRDPNRRRVKQLKEVARDRAKVKDAPVLMQVGDMPSAPKTRDIATESVQAPRITPPAPVAPAPKPEPQSLAADMGKAPEVDKDDPYAHLLTT